MAEGINDNTDDFVNSHKIKQISMLIKKLTKLSHPTDNKVIIMTAIK